MTGSLAGQSRLRYTRYYALAYISVDDNALTSPRLESRKPSQLLKTPDRNILSIPFILFIPVKIHRSLLPISTLAPSLIKTRLPWDRSRFMSGPRRRAYSNA